MITTLSKQPKVIGAQHEVPIPKHFNNTLYHGDSLKVFLQLLAMAKKIFYMNGSVMENWCLPSTENNVQN